MLASALVATSVAAAAPQRDFLVRLVATARAELAKAIEAHAPTLVPPVPVRNAWKPVRLGSVDLGAPLVAVAAADLDHDGKVELFAVTSREVFAIGLDKKAKLLARVPYTGEPSAQMPRDLVGTAAVDGDVLVAKCSGWASELRVSWHTQPAQLVGVLGDATGGSLVCPGERLVQAPGRNHFGDVANPLYEVRCRTDLVDQQGKPLRVRASLTGDKLAVTVGDRPFAYNGYGVAFALGDVNRDGMPEIAVTGAGAPGDPDAVKVFTIGGDEKKPMFRKVFQGGVAGLAIVDGDGDGISEVIAVVRLVGASRVDLWRLD